jgi:predicted MFS family arabinose efflux permease/ketosteroid isomerase-like protein
VTQVIHSKKSQGPAWGPVFALAIAVGGLLMAEFLPVSLLTPMAADLGITEGQTGQAITATAVVALLASLLLPAATRRIDRRHVLLTFSALLIASNLLVVFAPNLPVLITGRVLLGLATGGFWAMVGATAMRLVPEAFVPRALSIVYGAASIATILAAPLGSALEALIGWRAVFGIPAVLGIVALVWQLVTLPSMAPVGETRLRTLLDVLRRPRIGLGMGAVVLIIVGQYAVFTYLRPFLEMVTGVGVTGLSTILLAFGVAGFLGSSMAGRLIERSMYLTLGIVPLAMSALTAGLAVAGRVPVATIALIALWGFAGALVPVGWQAWVARMVPDEAESGGGLLVGAIQLAMSIGAAAGGVVFDASGPIPVFAVSSVLLLIAAIATFVGLRGRAPSMTPQPAFPNVDAGLSRSRATAKNSDPDFQPPSTKITGSRAGKRLSNTSAWALMLLLASSPLGAQTMNDNRIQILEDRAALRELVDNFSILADRKDVQGQVQLFTEDGTVQTHVGGQLVADLKGRNQLAASFEPFLATFETVYHFNGQHTVNIQGDQASGTLYCLVTLIGDDGGRMMKRTIGVYYNDEYVRQDGRWLIARRRSVFDWQDVRELGQ